MVPFARHAVHSLNAHMPMLIIAFDESYNYYSAMADQLTGWSYGLAKVTVYNYEEGPYHFLLPNSMGSILITCRRPDLEVLLPYTANIE